MVVMMIRNNGDKMCVVLPRPIAGRKHLQPKEALPVATREELEIAQFVAQSTTTTPVEVFMAPDAPVEAASVNPVSDPTPEPVLEEASAPSVLMGDAALMDDAAPFAESVAVEDAVDEATETVAEIVADVVADAVDAVPVVEEPQRRSKKGRK